jgi:hypothetical protein
MSRVERQLRKRWSRVTGRALSSLEEKFLPFGIREKKRKDYADRVIPTLYIIHKG